MRKKPKCGCVYVYMWPSAGSKQHPLLLFWHIYKNQWINRINVGKFMRLFGFLRLLKSGLRYKEENRVEENMDE